MENIEIITGIQSVNTDGSIDYDNGYTLEADGTLYDNKNNIVASDVASFNDATSVVTYYGGNTETLTEIQNGSTPGSNNQSGTPGQSFWGSQTPLFIGVGLIILSFLVKTNKT